MRIAVLLGAALVLAAPAFAEPSEAELDALVTPVIGRDTPGLAVLVMRKGEVLVAKGYGLADTESEAPVTADTIFDLASVSKQMTALLALKLALDGKLDLAAPLEEALPAFTQHEGERPVTANDLIHHVGGLADYEAIFTGETTDAEVVAFASKEAPKRAPGIAYEYSNTGYVVLASALAAVAGEEDYAALIRAEIFDPLEMVSTNIPQALEGLDPARIATGYKGEKGAFEKDVVYSITQGDGSVMASVNDLAKYEAALVEGSIVPVEAQAALIEPGVLDDGTVIDTGEGQGYGFGWDLTRADDAVRVAEHSGSWNGFATYYRRDLKTGLSVVVLSNDNDFAPGWMADEIAGLYDPE